LEVILGVSFGAFTLDAPARQLLNGRRPIHLSPKAFDLLALLVQRRPAAMSKRDLHGLLWPDTFVTDGSLAVLVAEIRAALGDSVRKPVFIRTLHRFGYAFVGPVEETAARAGATLPAVQWWLAADNERAPLERGDNVVGRDPLASIRVGLDRAADLRIDATGISRRHALIVVAEKTVTLHDLSSKNGTFANEVRVTTPVLLHDGASIRLGSVSLQFRRVTDMSATKTQEDGHEQTAPLKEGALRK
jgi:DNA-binding winged helix-turn-helix (wHTH) protein